VIGLLGGAFDPPHNGHVALARAALEQFGLERLVVLVSERPAHKGVVLDAEERLALAQAAFADLPRTEVRADPYARTIESVRGGGFGDAIFVVGADQFADFLGWTDPDDVLAPVRLGVATRPGVSRDRLEEVRTSLRRPDRVVFFELEPVDIASRDVRARVAAGQSIAELVPPPVAVRIRERGLYRREVGLH
jgi:nicotinate-nucleotide adenylyltransferase